jgi:hypothetical protein
MALNTKIRGLQINDDFFGAALARNGSDNDIMDVQVDDSTIEVNSDALRVKDDGITNAKLANMSQGTVKVGGASDAPTDLDAKTDGYILVGDGTDINSVAVSGDVTITNAGVVTIGADKVSNTKLANMTRGTVKVGGVDDAPTDLDANDDGKILIGDGTDVNSVAVSGDITITNAGVTTIGNDKVDNNKLANMTQGTVKVGGASDAPTDLDASGDGYILVGDGTDVNSVAVSGDVSLANDGSTQVTDLTISSETQGDLLYFDGANWVRLADAASAGYVLTSDAAGGLSWTAKTAIGEDYIQESEVSFEDETANCNGSQVAFTLSNSPVANSVQVFLNGLLQQQGSGKDYELSGTTVTFGTAPESGDILLVHYINT